jgi:AAA+ ATPase superfamily predicted ATPase
MDSDLTNWNWAGRNTCVDKFPNFKKWFEDYWPKISNIGISKYKRFIIKLENNKIQVDAYTGSLTTSENQRYWNNDQYSKSILKLTYFYKFYIIMLILQVYTEIRSKK